MAVGRLNARQDPREIIAHRLNEVEQSEGFEKLAGALDVTLDLGYAPSAHAAGLSYLCVIARAGRAGLSPDYWPRDPAVSVAVARTRDLPPGMT